MIAVQKIVARPVELFKSRASCQAKQAILLNFDFDFA